MYPQIERRLSEFRVKFALILAIGLLTTAGSLALLAPKAPATEVLPAQAGASTQANADIQAGQLSWFIPDNAYFLAAVGCTEATADFQIAPNNSPLDLNKNRSAVGTYSDDSGGVIGNLDEPPAFEDCAVYGPLTQPAQQYTTATAPVLIPGVTVDTQNQWTVTARNNGDEDPLASIGVPAFGVEITIPVSETEACVLDVAPDKPQSVLAEFVNGDKQNDAELLVDSQVLFSQAPSSDVDCSTSLGFQTTSFKEDFAFSQYEADYDVTSPGGPVQIVP